MTESLGHKAASGAIWATIDRFGYMALQFIVNLILANLLLPADFGIIGMLAIFISVSQVLIDGGFSSALIQKKNPTQIDYSTIFYWNLFIAAALYIILFFCAPWIASFYGLPILKNVLRVIGLNLVINGITSVQQTRLRKELAFRTIAIINLCSYSIGGGVAIYLAFIDWGVWSLVYQQLLFGILTIILFGIITKWYPSLHYSKVSMKELFGFGGYILAANVLQEVCRNFQGLIIGKKYSDVQMGLYSQAYKLDQVTSYSLPQIIVQVMYPIYSSVQDNSSRLIEILSMNIRVISFLVFPLFGLLILIADPLIVSLYGINWIASVSYYKIMCVGGFFICMQNVNFYAVAAKGYSKVLFNWSWYKWGFLLVAILVGMTFGMKGIIWGIVISNLNIYIVNACLVQRYVGLSIIEQIKEILPIGLVTLILLIISGYLVSENIINLWISVIFYAFGYLMLTCRTRSFKDVCNLAKRLIVRLQENINILN